MLNPDRLRSSLARVMEKVRATRKMTNINILNFNPIKNILELFPKIR